METAGALSPNAIATDLAEQWTAPACARSARHEAAAYTTSRLHSGVFGLAIASYAAMVLALWLLFATDTGTSLTLAIVTVYFAMFFGVPLAMVRVAKKDAPQPPPASLLRFLRGDMGTITGPIGGWAALAQVVVIPVSVTLGIVAIGLIHKALA